jgi:sulfatase maturation enzyme AslB (radical SAM superfamily)
MKFDDFKTVIDNFSAYIAQKCPGKKIKLLSLSGFGETLMHPDIIQMIKYTKQANIAEKIQIFSNGSLLTKQMSDNLVDAGLDILKISLQGINPDAYKKTCDFNIDWDVFISQLKYFYNNRKNCFLYLKVADVALNGEEDEKRFFELFSPFADNANIEHITGGNGVYYDPNTEEHRSVVRNELIDDTICNISFRLLELNMDGETWACARFDESGYKGPMIGNMLTTPFAEIWNVGVHGKFLKSTLEHNMQGNCKGCLYANFLSTNADILRGHEEEILERLNKF